MGTMGRKWIWNISCTMISWSVINIWSNCSTDCGVRTMRVTAALSDQYPAHNIQIFSHRFSPEFCISFKHKLIHLLSQFTVSFLLHCYNVVAFSWSFSQWNKASEIGMRLCTWLVFSPPSPRSLLPLLPSFHLLLVKNVQHSWQSHPPRVELDTWWITRHQQLRHSYILTSLHQ